MPLYHDEGVVLRTAKLGEADRIVTLLTRSHGKVRAVAKGVRRVKSRFGRRLEPFMRVDVLIATGRTLDVVSQVESISAYAAPICADYGAYGIANVMVETADKLVSAEKERAVAQYRLLVGALNALARHAHPARRSWNPMCCVRWLWPVGLRRLHSCVVCGRHVAVSPVAGESGDDGGAGEGHMSGPMFFSPSAGRADVFDRPHAACEMATGRGGAAVSGGGRRGLGSA